MRTWVQTERGFLHRRALEAMATYVPVVPHDARIEGLKLEILENYSGNRILAISGWLTKMARYFRLMKYPTDIWVDVIAACIIDAAQAWLDKELQDLQWVGATPGPVGQVFAMQWSKLSSPCLKWSMREGSLWRLKWVKMSQ